MLRRGFGRVAEYFVADTRVRVQGEPRLPPCYELAAGDDFGGMPLPQEGERAPLLVCTDCASSGWAALALQCAKELTLSRERAAADREDALAREQYFDDDI